MLLWLFVVLFLPQSEWHGLCFHDGSCRSHGGPHGDSYKRLYTLATRFNLWRSSDSQWSGRNISSRDTWLTSSGHNTRCGGQVSSSSRRQDVLRIAVHVPKSKHHALRETQREREELTHPYLSILNTGDLGEDPKWHQRKP